MFVLFCHFPESVLYSTTTIVFSSQEILERFTARQLRLAFVTQLWNAKIDFSETLMMNDVRNLENTINVRTVPFVEDPFDLNLDIPKQNFFTTTKALVYQGKKNGMSSDGHHHFESQEQELLQECVTFACR